MMYGVCEVCGKVKGAEVRFCCIHPEAQYTCNACYVAGKGSHREHSGRPIKLEGVEQ